MGDETRIYHGTWRNGRVPGGDYYAEMGLATLPRDRWGALGVFPGKEEGTVWSIPIRLPAGGCELHLNAEGAAAISVEIANEKFQYLPAFSGANSGMADGADGFELPLRWKGRSLAELGGQRVRLRVHLRAAGKTSPRLFAVYLTAASANNQTK